MDVFSIFFYLVCYVSLFVSIFWVTTFLSAEKKPKRPSNFPSLSILVPAFNHGNSLKRCILSLMRQNYPKLKILIIDDGSTDNTEEISRELAKKYRNIEYIKKKNSGKAASLNVGLRHVKTELFGFIDSDTHLSSNALRNMVRYIHDNVACTTAVIKPEKSNSVIERIQKVEYVISSFTRKLLSFLNSLYYTPAFAIYRTSVIREIGGFDENNVSEDLEIGLRLKNHGYTIENSIEDCAYTVVPKNFKGLFNQRMRWYRGYIYNTRKYSHILFNRRFGDLGVLVLPLQYLLLALITPFLFYSFYQLSLFAFRRITDFFIIGFDVNYMVSTAEFSIITPTTFFIITVFLSFMVMIRLSEKNVREKIGKMEYVIYILIYPFISWLLWTAAIIYELTGAERKW